MWSTHVWPHHPEDEAVSHLGKPVDSDLFEKKQLVLGNCANSDQRTFNDVLMAALCKNRGSSKTNQL